jgi:mono/diheme cytochrome c family protein
MTRTTRVTGGGLLVLACALVALVAWLNLRDETPLQSRREIALDDPALIERGAYLARAGNCLGCHTARGGADYAGGRAIDTPFGRFHAPNLTPDARTGLGHWTANEFWRALHNGRSKDGRLLYPSFPYPNYTQITREDSDAIYAFLRSLPAIAAPNRPHALQWPYRLQAALAVWRALYFRPGSHVPDAARSAAWNRGAYLVRGLGHCDACHAARNRLGATRTDIELGGGLLPMQDWYAPSLVDVHEAGVADWQVDDVVALLKTGTSPRGSVTGPMAEVVYRSTQYLRDEDLRAMAVFLQAQPQVATTGSIAPAASKPVLAHGKRLYDAQCAECHGRDGEGVAGLYPPLAGNRAVALGTPVNVLKVIVNGGFPPATAGNPRPFGMPPFRHALSDDDIAAVATYVRQSWGHRAGAVTELDVRRVH